MSDRWPAEIEELLAVYALDAVDDDERAIVDDYLRGNPRAVAEVESYREALSYLHSGSAAPPGLWERIATELETAPPPLRLDAFRTPPPARRRVGRILAIAAAVIALAAAGGVIVHQQREIDGRGSDSVAAAIEREAGNAQRNPQSQTVLLRDSGGALSVVAFLEPDGDLFLSGDQLPVLDRDRTYQLWCVRDSATGARVARVARREPNNDQAASRFVPRSVGHHERGRRWRRAAHRRPGGCRALRLTPAGEAAEIDPMRRR